MFVVVVSMKSGHVRSMPLFAVDPKYFDIAEVKRQIGLWVVPNNKHPWHDAPAKAKVIYKQISKQNLNTFASRGIARIKKKDL